MSEERERVRRLAKQAAARAVSTSEVSYKTIGSILSLSRENAHRRFESLSTQGGRTYVLTYTDLWMLASNNETAELARLLLAPLFEQVDRHNLRIADIERLAANVNTTETARIALKPTARMLWPDQFKDTADTE